jgi:hypothetical protein
MKSSTALLLMAGVGVITQLVCRFAGYGSADITTEIIIIICAAHICMALEDKL